MKQRDLIGDGNTDIVAEAASSSSVKSQDLHPSMVPHSPARPRAATPIPQAHTSSQFEGM
jgi:hypothetical protein